MKNIVNFVVDIVVNKDNKYHDAYRSVMALLYLICISGTFLFFMIPDFVTNELMPLLQFISDDIENTMQIEDDFHRAFRQGMR